MSIARVVNKQIEKQKKMMVDSFTSRGAYSKDKGIAFGQIYGTSNQHLVGFVQQMIRRGTIKNDGSVYWLDYEKYQKEQSRNKLAYTVLMAFSVFAVIAYFILLNI